MIAQYTFDPVTRGATGDIAIALSQVDMFTGVGSRIDLTGATISWTLKASGFSQTKSTAANGGLVLDAASSLVTYPLPPAATQALPLGNLAFGVIATFADGSVLPLLRGILPVQDLP
ncbi:hypothetical protein [Methylobacterium sp. WL6]|uniref:hypothetical protein n=1 Tax=Methylobacterium sp. WL6 TaxID=2603901 RepID=UPI0011C867E8|nr:hypothetical protein [Methylobacterium sp. WL6]TXN64990.1 hypothetical protein FV230_17595 [Methylobacterium sp. WL6]